MYSVENYSNTRFNVQFKEIRKKKKKNADTGFHEHFSLGTPGLDDGAFVS